MRDEAARAAFSRRPRLPVLDRTGLLGWALLALLAWRATVSAASLADGFRTARLGDYRRALTLSEDERIRSTLAQQLVFKGAVRPRDYLHELYRALLAHVPPGQWVFALAESDEKRVLAALRLLLYPRLLSIQKGLPGGELRPPKVPLYVLDFQGRHGGVLERFFSPVVRGPDWVLWH